MGLIFRGGPRVVLLILSATIFTCFETNCASTSSMDGETVAASGRLERRPGADVRPFKEVGLKVLTLNCWGVPLGGSTDINERFSLIGRHFEESDYDLLLFQEVWRDKDLQTLIAHLRNAYPHYHHFYSGYAGSGCCIFSKWKIMDVFMHHYSLNGYIHKLLHADFLAAKSLNAAVIEKSGVRVGVFTTHLHAEYDREKDEYLAHRVAQAYELSELVRWVSKSTDCWIVGGDLNLKPWDLGFRLILANGGLKDSWNDCLTRDGGRDNEEGNTCDIPSNSYVEPEILRLRPRGERLDYILYRDGGADDIIVRCVSCNVFSGKGSIPTKSNALSRLFPSPSTRGSSTASSRLVSFSDHEAVEAEFVIGTKKARVDEEVRGNDVEEERNRLKGILQESLQVLQQGMDKVYDDRVFCASIIFVALLSSTLLFYYEESHSSTSSFFFLPRLRLFCLNSWIGGVFQKFLFGVVFACTLHLIIISVFEYRALLANFNAIRLRLRYESES